MSDDKPAREAYAQRVILKLCAAIANQAEGIDGLATWGPGQLFVEIPQRRFLDATDHFVETGEGAEVMVNRGKELLEAWKQVGQKFMEKQK